MNRHVVDAVEREAALDPARSYIVQAPAGSGKTGLLIQRVLRLLATVARPEEILAITFTRKAAAEMRRRVLEALEGAAGDAQADTDNERLTRQLARAALERDRALGWQLAQNASRLRIQTIDALCASLARQMPVLSGIGAPPAIVEDPRELYREAAERTLRLIDAQEEIAAAVRRLLRHLDGDWAIARGLLEGMLKRRDQWLRRVAGFTADGAARAALEQSFRAERARLARRARALMPDAEGPEIARLARYAAANGAPGETGAAIARLAGLKGYPAPEGGGIEEWRALATFLLVAGKPRMRKAANKLVGFPAGDGVARAFKDQMKGLLARLPAIDGLDEVLHSLRGMPPDAFTDAQWGTLEAMVRILPRAAAELQLVFAERGEIDFPGLAQAAVTALGEEDAPTDLLLALDVRLKHLLVDEFQDTSRGQWELLTRLTAGWGEGDGRTVFLVGDPMQSIYRFREADVALFLRARAIGLPSVALTDVRLATNFRSQQGLVSWFNREFAKVLSAAEDAESGAVAHAPASAHHPEEPGLAVRWHAFVGHDAAAAREAEALRVAEVAQEALGQDPRAAVAILVRNRSHLDRIVPALRAAGIRFRAVDIEPLGARPVIQDLLALTRALCHLADRVAWLAVLRAPWCALTVADLLALAGAGDTPATLWELLHDPEALARMGAPGREAALRARERLAPFVEGRLRTGLRERAEAAWLALAGPACATQASDLEDAETYFDQLDGLERAGDLADPTLLEEHLEELYAAPDVGEDARLQLMTIHKAKGLEFSTVIVPGLDRPPRAPDPPLFAWKARADGSLMMAPIRAAREASEPAYDYLRALDQAATGHELERLFYVAATRARSRLHLFGFARIEDRKDGARLREPAKGSLLGKAWNVAREHFLAALPSAQAAAAAQPAQKAARDELRRLEPAAFEVAVAPAAALFADAVSEAPAAIEFSWAGETARHVGIVTHRWLQRIAAEGIEHWDTARVATLAPSIARDLARRGIPAAERTAASNRIRAALEGALADPRGRWLLATRPGAHSEYRLRVAGARGVRLVVIDRTFTDEAGQRWIVDFKTSAHEGAGLDAFLDRELERYAPQLEGYAAAFGGEPVALGLYFPLVRGWRERR